MPKNTLITGVLGDIHSLGLRVLESVLRAADFEVVYAGARLSVEDFIRAAQETDAGAILISSSSGHAEIDAQGIRGLCREAGIERILLYIGGNLVVSQQLMAWTEIEARFRRLGFDRVYPTTVDLKDVVRDLRADLGIGSDPLPSS